MSILSAEFDIDVAKRVWSDEGREEGKGEERIKIALRLLKRNRPIGEIIEDTGLTHEEVENLRDTN